MTSTAMGRFAAANGFERYEDLHAWSIEDLRDKAPDELKDEYDVLVGALDGEGSEEEFQAANDPIIEYTTDNCDVAFPS